MKTEILKIAAEDVFELNESELRETALTYLCNAEALASRIAFLSVFGEDRDLTDLADFDRDIKSFKENNVVDTIQRGEISTEQLTKLCVHPKALKAAFDACETYFADGALDEKNSIVIPSALNQLLAQWTPDGSWLRKAKHSANVIRDYVKELRDLVDGVFACQFHRDVLAMSGDGGSPNSNADESQSTNEETFEPRVRNGLVEMRCRKDDAPFGFGLLTIFDATKEATLLVCQPVLLSASPISYNLEVPLSDLFDVVPEHGDPEFVAASVATRHLFTKPMLEALMKLTANGDQRALIEDFIALIGD
jgi:hypothetical protein